MVHAGEFIPGRRRDHRGRRVGRRVGDHRRVGAGHPRVGRRSLGRHRRHARHFRLDQGAGDVGSRPHVPGPHDRARRRRRAAEDAERDRAEHPAGGADAGLSAGRRDAAAVRVLRRHRDSDSGADRAARVPDSDDDRRADLGDRHRRHGPPGAAQRAGDVRARGRSGRRRRTRCCSTRPARSRSATARRPSSCRCPASPRASSRTRRSWRRSPTRRRRDGRSSCSPRRSTGFGGASWRDKEAAFVPFTAQTRMSGVNLDGREIRKGAADAIAAYVTGQRRHRRRRAAGHRRAHRPVGRHAAGRRRADARRSASCT